MAAAEAHPPPTHLQVTSLYVGDLDPRVSERELYEAFTSLSSSITSIHLCRDSSGRSLRYAYVNFISHDKASKALDSLNHTYLIGKPVRIMWSQKDPLPRKSGVANLFVKNLDHSVDSAGLQEIFSKFGNILSCKVAEENGQSKGFGFVQFDSEESALAAIKALHDTLLHGKKLYVSKFIKKSDRQNTCELKYTNLYVKNLDHDLTEDLLLDKFSDFGKVCNVVIMKDNQGKSKGFGFINFESAEDAKKAVEAMNGAKLGSKTLYVGRAQKKAEREKILKHTYEELQNKQTDNMKNSNVCVKNLDVSVDDSKLQELFSSCGKITSARVMHYDDGRSKGFGFVSFSTPKEAKKALDTLNGKMFEGRSLYVTMVQCKENHRTSSASHLQFAQHPSGFLPSSVSNFAPELLPTLHGVSYKIPHQPIMYQQIGMNMAALFPPKEQYYGTMLPTSFQCKQTQQRQTMGPSILHGPYDPYLLSGIQPITTLQGIQKQPAPATTNIPYEELKHGASENQKPHLFEKVRKKSNFRVETVFEEKRKIKSLVDATDPWNHKQADKGVRMLKQGNARVGLGCSGALQDTTSSRC